MVLDTDLKYLKYSVPLEGVVYKSHSEILTCVVVDISHLCNII